VVGFRYMRSGTFSPAHHHRKDGARDEEHESRNGEEFKSVDGQTCAEEEGPVGTDAGHSGQEKDGRYREGDKQDEKTLHFLGKPSEPAGVRVGGLDVVKSRHAGKCIVQVSRSAGRGRDAGGTDAGGTDGTFTVSWDVFRQNSHRTVILSEAPHRFIA
jgi:hypothetical protein